MLRDLEVRRAGELGISSCSGKSGPCRLPNGGLLAWRWGLPLLVLLGGGRRPWVWWQAFPGGRPVGTMAAAPARRQPSRRW